MRDTLKIAGGFVVAEIVLYAIGHNRTATAWFGASLRISIATVLVFFAGFVIWLCISAGRDWMRHPTFPSPRRVFAVIAVGLLIWTLFAPGGFLECRPTATGNVIVDYVCVPLYDSTYPKESKEAIEKFWAGRPTAKP
jgi:hypothetical protein